MICETYVQFFGTLADPTKLEILKALRDQPMNVTQLTKKTSFEQSRISHTLRKLREVGFVTMKPNGKERVYSVDSRTILPLLALIDHHIDRYYKHYCKCTGEVKKLRWEKAFS